MTVNRFLQASCGALLAFSFALAHRLAGLHPMKKCTSVVATVLSIVCGSSFAGTIKDLGYYGVSLDQHTTAWIDDNRLLFISPGRGSPADDLALYIWNVKTDAITKHAELAQNGSMCYAEGFIRYWYTRDGSFVQHAGRFGEEKAQIDSVDDSPARKGLRLNRLTCRYFRDGDLPRNDTVFFRPLREADGYLGYGVDPKSDETFFLPKGSSRPLDLKSARRAVVLIYSVYGKSYVLREAPSFLVRDSGKGIRFWIFRPPLDLGAVSIPPGPWLGGSIAAVEPTAGGIAFTSHAPDKSERESRSGTGAGGLYLLNNGNVTKVTPGYAYGMSVSPNGCAVALNVIARVGIGHASSIKIARLCGGGAK